VAVAGAGGSGNAAASSARKQVRHILEGPQYHSRPERTFQPFRGAIDATGRWFDRVFGPAWRWVAHHLFHPLGTWLTTDIGLPWPVTILAIALIAGLVAGVISIRRRPRIGFAGMSAGGTLAGEDPRRLEELARQAELAGDLRAAIRLRFRAGVANLDNLGVISRGPTRTTAEIADALGSEEFDALAADLEEIVYGGVAATQQQALVSRSAWPVVVSQAEHAVRTEMKVEHARSTQGPTS
jgi:hypothetical protein